MNKKRAHDGAPAPLADSMRGFTLPVAPKSPPGTVAMMIMLVTVAAGMHYGATTTHTRMHTHAHTHGAQVPPWYGGNDDNAGGSSRGDVRRVNPPATTTHVARIGF